MTIDLKDVASINKVKSHWLFKGFDETRNIRYFSLVKLHYYPDFPYTLVGDKDGAKVEQLSGEIIFSQSIDLDFDISQSDLITYGCLSNFRENEFLNIWKFEDAKMNLLNKSEDLLEWRVSYKTSFSARDIEVGDTIVTFLNEYVVGEVIYDDYKSNYFQPMYLPEGGDDYTYLIPFENILSVKKRVFLNK